MENNGVSYIFPSDVNIELFSLPKTAIQKNISFEPREYIIESIIPDKNEILKSILYSNPNMPFGYIDKGNNETRTIEDASTLLDYEIKKILKTLVTKDADENIYMVVTFGNYHPNLKKIKHLSEIFRNAHDIDGPLKLHMIDSEQVEKFIGMPAGFCGPVLFNKDYIINKVDEKNVKGILFHHKIKKTQQRYTIKEKYIMITFPISKNESILIHPRDLYEKLKDKCGEDKISFFKE
ncbi:MAG: YbaK/EbsC family protein [Candidatus Aenigmarchaeota archaeon]|nr:YbaK/EbsC family protein [Candidatus Aenigmarchaeota archaeon]